MDDEARKARTLKIIETTNRLIKEVEATLEAGQRMFAERGIDRNRLQEYVRRVAGVQGEREIRAHVERAMQQIKQQADQATQHRRFDAPATGRPRRLRNLV